jgi:hypothetical protein
MEAVEALAEGDPPQEAWSIVPPFAYTVPKGK